MSIQVFRLGVFWIWAVTMLVALGSVLWFPMNEEMKFHEVEESLSQVMGLIAPQVGMMVAFFFGSGKTGQERLIGDQRSLARFAVVLSVLYHVVFWIVLWLAFVKMAFDKDLFDANTAAVLEIVGYISVFGLAPVAYLFASGSSAGPGQSAGMPTDGAN